MLSPKKVKSGPKKNRKPVKPYYIPEYQFVSPSTLPSPGGLLIEDLEIGVTHPDVTAALGTPVAGTIRGKNVGISTDDSWLELDLSLAMLGKLGEKQ